MKAVALEAAYIHTAVLLLAERSSVEMMSVLVSAFAVNVIDVAGAGYCYAI